MPSPSIERVVTIKTSTVLKLIGIGMGLWFMWIVRDILALLIVALFMAALLHPAVRWGARHKMPKGLMVIAIYVIAFAIMALAFALIIPTLLQQIGTLSQTIGSSIETISGGIHYVQELSSKYGLANNLSASVASVQHQLSQIAGSFFAALTNIFGGMAGLAVVLVMAFYMVVQDEEAVRLFKNFVPDPYQDISAQILRGVEDKIGSWLSGQLILSLIIGILYYIGLLILGVDSALALAFFCAFAEFIPYLGPILGGIPVVIVAFTDSPLKALLAMGLMLIIQQIENQIVVPKVMQKAVGLNPLISIIAVLVGAKLFNVVGALLAIPVATSLSVALTELYRFRRDIPAA